MYAVLRIEPDDTFTVMEWFETAKNALDYMTECEMNEDGYIYRAVYSMYGTFRSLTNDILHFS